MSNLNVGARVALVATSADRSVLARLATDESVTVAREFFNRHAATGDLDDAWLDVALEQHAGNRHLVDDVEAISAVRPLPLKTSLRLAHLRPKTLLHATEDIAAAAAADGDGDEAWPAVLAWRASDVEALTRILRDRDPNDPGWQELQDLLLTRVLPQALVDDQALIDTLLQVADWHDGSEEADNLRVVAAQNDQVVAKHAAAVLAEGTPLVSAAGVVVSGMGPYGGRLSGPRVGAFRGAQRLWEAADITLEQTLARTVVADSGATILVVETPGDTFIATPEALRAYNKTGKPSYTYVHLHLTEATSSRLSHPSGAEIRIVLPSSLPALPYFRERAPRPDDPDGPELDTIVWRWPFAPAIYTTTNTELGIAVADGRVAITEPP